MATTLPGPSDGTAPLPPPGERPGPPWWVGGVLDGVLGLGLDNLIQILLILTPCRGLLGYPGALVFGTVLPATGISLVVGNLAHARQAFRLDQQEGGSQRTALPYGINTVSLFAYVFLVVYLGFTKHRGSSLSHSGPYFSPARRCYSLPDDDPEILNISALWHKKAPVVAWAGDQGCASFRRQ